MTNTAGDAAKGESPPFLPRPGYNKHPMISHTRQIILGVVVCALFFQFFGLKGINTDNYILSWQSSFYEPIATIDTSSIEQLSKYMTTTYNQRDESPDNYTYKDNGNGPDEGSGNDEDDTDSNIDNEDDTDTDGDTENDDESSDATEGDEVTSKASTQEAEYQQYYNLSKAEAADPLLHKIPATYRTASRIPTWMKKYFDWHRIQTAGLNETNWNRDKLVEAEVLRRLQNTDNKESDSIKTPNILIPQPPPTAEGGYKFLIVKCLNIMQCGGLSDRLKPLPFYVAVAAHLKPSPRILYIRWERPYPLEEFLVPNEINWTVPSFILEELKAHDEFLGRRTRKRTKKDEIVVLKNGTFRQGMKVSRKTFSGVHIATVLDGNPVTVAESNMQLNHIATFVYQCLVDTHYNLPALFNASDYRHCSRRPPVGSATRPDGWSFSQRGSRSYRKIYHDFFRTVFRPSDPVQAMIDSKLKAASLTAGEFVGAHYRSNYAGEADDVGTEFMQQMAKTLARCAGLMATSQSDDGGSLQIPPVYFASDTAIALQAVRDDYRKISLKNPNQTLTLVTPIDNQDGQERNATEKKPFHIEFDEGPVEEFYPAFVDLLVMGSSKCQLYGVGGFGSFASLLSYNAECYYDANSCKGGKSPTDPASTLILPDKCCYGESAKLQKKETKPSRKKKKSKRREGRNSGRTETVATGGERKRSI